MRSSASECASCSAPGGWSPSARRRNDDDSCSSQTSGAEDREEGAHGRRDRQRGPLRVAERDPLRHELADHDVQIRDDQQRDDHREHRRHKGVELVGEHLLAERADPEARHRHAELHGSDEPRRVAGDLEHLPGAAIPLVLKLEDPRSARGDQAVLGPDEERVRNDQANKGQHLEGERHRERPVDARVLGGRSSSTRISRRSIAGRATDRTYVLSWADAGRVSGRAVQGRAEPCQRHALRLVAQPLHGLRPPVHLLLRARIRASRRPPVGPPLRDVDPREAQHRRSPAGGARARELGGGARRDRRRHRSIPAGRRPVPADACVHRGAARRLEPIRHHHPRAADRP